MAKEVQLKLKEGDKAPTFTAMTNGENTVSLSDYSGKPVMVFL